MEGKIGGRFRLLSQQRRHFRTKRFLLAVLATVTCAFFIISQNLSPSSPPTNYFLEATEYSELGYVLDTSTCHILNISAWHKSIRPFLENMTRADDQCNKQRKWTYISEQQKLIVNISALKESGFSFKSISCCFKYIRRPESTTRSTNDADSVIEFSSPCQTIEEEETELKEEFVRVLCTSKYWPWSMDVIYRYFHAVPLPSNNVREKALKWKETKKESAPHVFILGIDSMSRLSFQRNMPKTRTLLQEIGAYEMFGYTKVGENTFPNAVAFMMGHFKDELPHVCNYSTEAYLDSCPFIWKNFSNENYITTFVEDAPFLATYNYAKLGFFHKPVDYYFRPYMLGLNYYLPRKTYYYLECVGKQTVDEMVLEYLGNVLKTSDELATPSFIYSWLTNLAHGDLNKAQTGDKTFSEFLQSVDLNNTILFFMSDHGYRYGNIRQTFVGWYEDKLPNFWVYIPPKIKLSFPQWDAALKSNARKLSSPFDLHQTLRHILHTYSLNLPPFPNLKGMGQSLFFDIPENRRCSDAGISDNLCACYVPQKLDVNDEYAIKAAHVALFDLNMKLPKQCSKLTLSTISAVGMLEAKTNFQNKTYIVAFYAQPGNFLFEGSVEVSGNDKWGLTGELLRMNKINTDVSCVKGNWENFCYCAL